MIHVTIQQLSSYLDEQLNDSSADLVRQHVAECQDCGTRLGTLARMDAAITRALSHEPGDDLFRRLEREIASKLAPDAAAMAQEILDEAPKKASAPARVTSPDGPPPRNPKPRVQPSPAPSVSRPSVREVPPTAWTPNTERGTATRVTDPPRPKESQAGMWVSVLSLAVIAGSVGVVVSHTGAVQGWLDGLISKPNFSVSKPGAPTSANDPVTAADVATDSTAAADVLAMIEGTPSPEPESQAPASTPLPPPPPRSSRANDDFEPVDDFDESGGQEFTEEETTPQTMRADEALATPGSTAASGRGPGGDRRADPYAGLRPESQAAVREAERVHQQTLFHPTAEQFEVAATRWERALEGVSGPEQVTIRGRLADARYRAWEAGPTAERADAAMSAIRSYLLFAPPGTAREEARARLSRLDPR